MRLGNNDPRGITMSPTYETDWLIPESLINDEPCHCETVIRYDFDLAECIECGTAYVIEKGYIREF